MLKKLLKEKKKFLKYLQKSQANQFKNTVFLKRFAREEQMICEDTLPGIGLAYCETRLKVVRTEQKKLLKYLLRSQKAINRNLFKIKKVEKEITSIRCPKLLK